ncbi:hypothetical protein LT679_12540 [Mucilaginibacter roseus]|uniref:Uncharacterized protein n=1 Tax=Mucilaginibacter roseus TaxID=1528868 RepID=A0ABS8U710_9SPHI|nr:hypothetical protein [Mucilaginibacter roseus]MCD8741436.1 hypothetical protein [Mucilaginibacter roseus]
MRVEDTAAYRYLFNEDIFLLNSEKHLFNGEPLIAGADKAPLQPEPEVETPAKAEELKPAAYLGQNKKGLLILTYYNDEPFIAADHQAALEATLKRKDYTIDDIAIVNLAGNNGLVLFALQEQLKPTKLLVLGKQAAPAELNKIAFNQPQQFENLPVLITFAFGEMMTSNENKKAFWEQVKNF